MASLSKVAEILSEKDNIEILTHHYPDGDTLGSAATLCRGLRDFGKTAFILENPEVPNVTGIQRLDDMRQELEELRRLNA